MELGRGALPKPLQGAEIAPGSKIPLGKLRAPGHAVLCCAEHGVLSPVEDESDESVLSLVN